MDHRSEQVEFTKETAWIGFIAYLIVALIIAMPFI